MKLAILATILSFANANLVISSFPSATAGTTQTIYWTYDGKPEMKSVDIEVVTGDPNSLTVAASVATGVDPNKLSYDWKVPNNLPSNQQYTIRLQGTNMDGNKDLTLQFYNAPFKVIGGGQTQKSGAAKVAIGSGTLAAAIVALLV